jgi:hypothetical protein
VGDRLNHFSLKLCTLSSADFSNASIRDSSFLMYFLSSESSGMMVERIEMSALMGKGKLRDRRPLVKAQLSCFSPQVGGKEIF